MIYNYKHSNRIEKGKQSIDLGPLKQDNESVTTGGTVSPKIHVPPEPQNVALFGSSMVADVISGEDEVAME